MKTTIDPQHVQRAVRKPCNPKVKAMIFKPCYEPKTGADSVPLPEKLDSLHDLSWSKYLNDKQRAAREETAEQSIERCRGQAGSYDRHRQFDGTLAMLLDTFDTTVGIEKYAGLGLDECGFFYDGMLADLRQHWTLMEQAFTAGDRTAYVKAAADFARDAAIFTFGVVDAPKGGAA